VQAVKRKALHSFNRLKQGMVSLLGRDVRLTCAFFYKMMKKLHAASWAMKIVKLKLYHYFIEVLTYTQISVISEN
jgi:hypothetical protein